MSAEELDTAQQFQSAAQDALRTGDAAAVVALLAGDVECMTPQRTLRGSEASDAIAEDLLRARPSESLEVEFESDDWKSLGDGRYVCEIRAHYRSKSTGEVSYSRDRTFELTIRAGEVSRLEMRFAG